jgi:hypothetical protein
MNFQTNGGVSGLDIFLALLQQRMSQFMISFFFLFCLFLILFGEISILFIKSKLCNFIFKFQNYVKYILLIFDQQHQQSTKTDKNWNVFVLTSSVSLGLLLKVSKKLILIFFMIFQVG